MKTLRASESGIWANCPGSTELTKMVRPDTQESREGDLLHLMTCCSLKGTVVPDNPSGLIITEEYQAMAREAAEYCSSLGVEQPIYETHVLGGALPEGVQGTLDFGGYDPEENTIHIVDFKFGFSPVEAIGNYQLLIYSIGIAGLLQGLEAGYSVFLHIYQPRDFTSPEPFKVWELSHDEWVAESLELAGKALSAQEGGFTQTGSHCRHCKSRMMCKAFQESAASVLESVVLDPLDMLPTPANIGAGFDYLKRAEAIIVAARKAFEDYIVSEIEGGRPVHGWQIGSTNGRRSWSAPIETIKSVAMMNGLTLTEEKPISITAAWRNKEARPMLETLVTKGEGSKKLIPFDGKATEEVFNNG